MEGTRRLKLEADALLHFAAEPLDAAVLNRVLEAGVLAVGPVAEIALGGEDGGADLVHLVRGNEAEKISQTGEGLGVAVAHAESAANGHVVSREFPVFDDRDVTEVLGEDIDIVGGGDGEACLEFAREVGVAVHRLGFGFPSGDQFLIEEDLMVGARPGEGIVAPTRCMLVDLLEDFRALGIRRGHHVAVHVAAGRDRVEQGLIHPLDEFLDVPLDHPVELEGLPGGEAQGRGCNVVGEFVEDEPLLGRGLSTGQADAAHEGEGLLFSFLLEAIAQVSVILHVEAVELGELVALLGNVPRGSVGQIGGDVSAEMARVDLHSLVGGEGLGSGVVGAHGCVDEGVGLSGFLTRKDD